MAMNSKQRIARALQIRAEQAIPDALKPPPSFRERVEATLSDRVAQHCQSQVVAQTPGSTAGVAAGRPQQKSAMGKGTSLLGSHFRFKMAAALVGLVAATLIVLSVAALAGGQSQDSYIGQHSSSAFLTPGKVRHVVISDTTFTTDLFAPVGDRGGVSGMGVGIGNQPQDQSNIEDLWYTQGSDHLLLRMTDAMEGASATDTTFIGDATIYTYSDSPGQENKVYRAPYTPRYFQFYGPDPQIVTRTLALPGARLRGSSILDGRNVVEIEAAGMAYQSDPASSRSSEVPADGYELATPQVPSQSEESSVALYRVWIDAHTYQILLAQYSVKYITGPRSGQVTTQQTKVMLDETKDAAELPSDFFQVNLPQVATVIDQQFTVPIPTHTPIPALAYTPTAPAKP